MATSQITPTWPLSTSTVAGTVGTFSNSILDYSNTVYSLGSSPVYSITSGASTPSGLLKITGPEADIEINGKSLSSWMQQVEERLNILDVNHELEAEWDQLRELGNRYRALEQQCKEKSTAWNKLKKI